jgi:hypothetical protein
VPTQKEIMSPINPNDFSPSENERFSELEARIVALEALASKVLTPLESSELLALLDHFGIRPGY